jgi:hypothetical protein
MSIRVSAGFLLAFSVVAVGFGGLAAAPAAHADTYRVTQTRDGAGACDDRCKLREAIVAANATPADDVIRVPRGRYELTLDGPESGGCDERALTGDLDVCRESFDEFPAGTGELELIGAGARRTIVDANRIDRVLHIYSDDDAPGEAVTVEGLTLTGGRTDEGGGGLQLDRSRPTTVSRTIIRGNRTFGAANTSADGGGIQTVGDLTLIDSLVRDNVAGSADSGGGIYARRTLRVIDSTIADNLARSPTQSFSSSGGGIFIAAEGTIENSTVSGNTVRSPGGGAGGGIYTDGQLGLTNVTIARNQSGAGGGIFAANRPGENFQDAVNTIIAGNVARQSQGGPNCSGGGLVSLGGNLDSGRSCGFTGPGDLERADARLGPLSDNGGPTPTHDLEPGSEAINAGSIAECPERDQRGVRRPQGNGCDIGAVERKR